MEIIKVSSESEMKEKLQEWCDRNVYDDPSRKFREDKGFYQGHPALFIIHGNVTECIAYNALTDFKLNKL